MEQKQEKDTAPKEFDSIYSAVNSRLKRVTINILLIYF